MRTISAAQAGVLLAGTQGEFVRFSVKDSGGTFRDLTQYPGFNAVKSVQWSEHIDDPGATFSVELLREMFGLSLSPFMGGSGVNRGFDPTVSPLALVAVNREVKIEAAIMPMGTQPSSGDWFEVLRGRIDLVDPGQGETVQVQGRGLQGRLAQQFIKAERVYSLAAVGGLAVSMLLWQPNLAVTTSPLVYLLPATRGDADPGLNKFFKCSQAGTTGTTEPTWSTGAGIVDGTAKWDYVGALTTTGNPVEQIIQNILDDNIGIGDVSVTLYTPSSPGWGILQFQQQQTFTLDAIRTLAQQLGWDVRFKWKAAASAFTLTFYQPTRTSPSVDHTFAASTYLEPTQLEVNLENIRNSWRITYSDAASLWPDGTPVRKVIDVSDGPSITKYGELWAMIQEDQASQIDSAAEATALANAALSDCKEPTMAASIQLAGGFPWVELNDYYTFSADGVHYDADQSLAVTQWQHQFQDGKMKTALGVRGFPTAGTGTWLGNTVHPHIPPRDQTKHTGHRTTHFSGVKTPTQNVGHQVGGAQITLAQTFDRVQLPADYEIHVYTTPGTTLSNSTLFTVSRDVNISAISGLTPGKTYYARTVPRFTNVGRMVRGQPSIETSFVAGQAQAQHLTAAVDWSRAPLNGGFETAFDPSTLPDHWTATAGTWGTNMLLLTDGAGVSGSNYIRFTDVAASRTLGSDLFQVEAGALYHLTCWMKEHSAVAQNGQVQLKFYDSSQTLISTPIILQGILLGASWLKYQNAAFAPSNAKFAKVEVTVQSGASTEGFDVDEIRVERLYATGAVTWGNSSLPNANGTTFMQPGGGGGAAGANEIKIPLPDNCYVAGLRVWARVGSTNVSYAISVNGTIVTATLAGGATTASDTTDILQRNGGTTVSIKVVATAGGGPVGAVDVVVSLGIYQP